MIFEFVEYYPLAKKSPKSCTIGTCHIYWVDQKMDIRGIKVRKEGKKIVYSLPTLIGKDEQGNPLRYPVISFTDPTMIKEIFHFCQKQVTPKIGVQ